MSIEKDAIDEGYHDEVKGMFHPFLIDFLQNGAAAAADKFTKGLAKIREAHDLAVKSIPTITASAVAAPRKRSSKSRGS